MRKEQLYHKVQWSPRFTARTLLYGLDLPIINSVTEVITTGRRPSWSSWQHTVTTTFPYNANPPPHFT